MSFLQPDSPGHVSFKSCALPSHPSPCGRLSRPQSTMSDPTPPRPETLPFQLRSLFSGRDILLTENRWGLPGSLMLLFTHATVKLPRQTLQNLAYYGSFVLASNFPKLLPSVFMH